MIFAIDPGNERSAFVLYAPTEKRVVTFGIHDNATMLGLVRSSSANDVALAVEMVASYGMPVGREVFDTVFWIGRFVEAWARPNYTLVFRREVKMLLCGQTKAKDTNVRQSLIDIFGPGRKRAIGTKASPGALYGFKSDVWAALGVAYTVAERSRVANPVDGRVVGPITRLD